MAEEQNDLQGVSSVVDRERFLLPGHKGWRIGCFVISPFLKLKMLGVSSDRI